MLTKKDKTGKEVAIGEESPGELTATGEYKIALDALDEALQEKKNVLSSAKKLTQKLSESIPPPKKARTA
jgi:hypothetical protein